MEGSSRVANVGLESGKSMYSIDLVEADKEIDDYAK